MNLNKYQSTYIDQPGMYEVTITEAKNDYTRSGKECVFVKFETEKNQATIWANRQTQLRKHGARNQNSER